MLNNGRHLCLSGMAGVGKSWIGEELAKLLGWPWIDIDNEIEKATGKSVSEIFADDGEACFRVFETEEIKVALASPIRSVISLGGGAILERENRALLEKLSIVVYLRASLSTLHSYLVSDVSRPLLSGNLSQRLESLLSERGEIYTRSSNFIVDVDGKDLAGICEEILSVLNKNE